MAIVRARQSSAAACSVVAATTVELDGGYFDLEDALFSVSVAPVGAGTGTLNVEYSTNLAPTVFTQAKLDDGSNLTCDLSKVEVFTVSGVDIHSIKLTPSGVAGVTGYNYSICACDV